jgi:hypothetical protein
VKEILTFQAPEPDFSACALDVLESDFPVFICNNVLFAENTTVEITGQVFQYGNTLADMLTINYPLRRLHGRKKKTGFLKS